MSKGLVKGKLKSKAKRGKGPTGEIREMPRIGRDPRDIPVPPKPQRIGPGYFGRRLIAPVWDPKTRGYTAPESLYTAPDPVEPWCVCSIEPDSIRIA